MSTVIVQDKTGPGCLVQLLWFIFIGWWAGQLWIGVAWLLMLSIIGIPFGVKMMNMLPQVIALRGQSQQLTITADGDTTLVSKSDAPQQNIVLRAVYFLLIGWWLSGLWIEAAYLICLTIIGLPVGFWMFDKVPGIVSLRR